MAEIKDYSTTAGSNNSASPNGMPENMAPSGVNDSWREGIARVKRWYEDVSAVNPLAGGTLTYTLAASRTISAYAAGDVFLAICNATNTGAPTLNVDSVGAKNIVTNDQTALAAGQLVADGIYQFAYDANNDTFICLNPTTVRSIESTVATTSGTSAEFTGIPAWCNEFILTLVGVSVSGGTDGLAVQLGDSGGYETSGYNGSTRNLDGSTANTWSASALVTASAAGAANTWHGQVRGVKYGTNSWSLSIQVASSAAGSVHDGCGSKILTATLDRVKIFLPTATDAFDNGAVGMVLIP